MRAEEAAGRVSRPRLGKQERCLLVVGSWESRISLTIFPFQVCDKILKGEIDTIPVSLV